MLKVVGATGSLPPFQAIGTVPSDGQRLASSPSTFTVHFNDLLQLTSVQSSDLLVDGIAASNVTITDATTAVFTLPAFAEGSHQVTINAGAILDRQATPIQPFTSTFIIDQTGPRITASSIHEGDTVPVGNLVYTAVFNEDMNTTTLDPTDFSLVGGWSGAYTPDSFAWIDPRTVRLQFGGLGDDTYTLTLLSGAGQFQDLVGNTLDGEPHTPFSLPSGNGHSGGSFLVHFTADAAVAPFPTPLSANDPLGSLIYNGSTQAVIGAKSDVDSYTVVLDVGQTLTAVVVPASALRPKLSISGPGGVNVGPTSAAAAGKQVFIQTVPVTTAGTYTITVASTGTTNGYYSLQLVLNAAVEEESHDGLGNNAQPGQNIDASFISLSAGAQRAAVLGSSDGSIGYLPNEVEPNNTTAAANDAHANFSAYSAANLYQMGIVAAITPGADADWYQIGDLDAGDVLTLSMSGSPSSRGTLSDCYLALYRYNNGTPLKVAYSDNGGPGADSLINHFAVTTADDYYVCASAAKSTYTGTYALGLWLENLGAALSPAAHLPARPSLTTPRQPPTTPQPVGGRSSISLKPRRR